MLILKLNNIYTNMPKLVINKILYKLNEIRSI